MTTLTVLVISFPLVFSTGQGSEFGQRMGIVMFGGIVFSAILTFFVVPAAFFAFEKNGKNAAFNASEAEIEAACADIEEDNEPESCEPEGEPEAARETAASLSGLVDEERASSADTGPAKTKKSSGARKTGVKNTARASEDEEEYEI